MAKALGVNLAAVNVSVSTSLELASVAKSNEYPIAFRPKGKKSPFCYKKVQLLPQNPQKHSSGILTLVFKG